MSTAELIRRARAAVEMPEDMPPQPYGNVSELLADAVARFGDYPAFTCLGHTLSYAELDRHSAAFGAYLQHELGLEPGDRIAIQMPNLLQYPVVFFGAMRAGLTVVNTNPMYTEREMVHQFNDSGARALVVLANFADRVAQALPQTGIERVIISETADLHPLPRRLLINAGLRYLKKAVPAYSLPGAVSLRRALALGRSAAPASTTRGLEDLAVLQYTGGTTGVAKGAMLSHGNLLSNIGQAMAVLRSDEDYRDGEEVLVLPLPLYHIYAFNTSMGMMSGGNHVVLIPDPRNLDALIDDIERWRATSFAGLNTLFVSLCNNARFRQLDFSRLRLTLSGGMALTQDAAEQWRAVTGVEITEGYGMTETSPTVSVNPRRAVRIGTIGIPVPGTEVRILDDEDRELGVNEAGELCVRGPQVMQGYWQRPEETAKVMNEDGWLRTGDIAVVTEEGYLKIVDRKKDMIVVSGFNVYPNEIEDVVVQHPGVLECAVIGVPDERSGEAVKLFVVKRDAGLTEDQLKQYCREQLTGYKIPRHVVFRDDLPKSNVGKILRRELREA